MEIMITAKKLKEEYERKLKYLQESCKHNNVTDWLQQEWAPAHRTRYMVKQCNTCWKLVSKKTRCDECKKEIIDDEIKKGNGKPSTPYGGAWCNDCFNKLKGDKNAIR